jgi:hypothetical protein
VIEPVPSPPLIPPVPDFATSTFVAASWLPLSVNVVQLDPVQVVLQLSPVQDVVVSMF